MPEPGTREAHAYTDGASTGSRGPGGYGAVLRWKGKTVEISGGEQNTTNLRMELTAACVALETIDEGHVVSVYSDSSYLINCMRRGWYKKWRENGWLNHLGEPVANRDLWERLLKATQRHQEVRWRKVKDEFSEVRVSPSNTYERARRSSAERSDRWKKGCTAPPLGTITARPRKTDQKEDAVGRKSDRPTHKRESAFEKLQSERAEKGLEEDLERDEEEREERKQIRQEEREESKQIRQEEREERKRERERERERARGQEESS